MAGCKPYYNVWVIVEEYCDDEDNGKDIDARKLAKFEERENAELFASGVEKDCELR